MRVLLLTPFWKPVPGGISRYVGYLRDYLVSIGHRVRVLALAGRSEEGVAILTGGVLVRFLREFAEIRRFRPDVVHVHGHWMFLAPAVAWRLGRSGRRVIFTFHTTARARGLRRILFSFLLNRSDGVTAVSADLLARMASRFRIRVPISRTSPGVRLPDPVRTPEFSVRGQLDIPAGAPLLVTVCPLAYPRKVEGLADLVRALPSILSAYPDVRLVVVGDGRLRPYVETVVSDLRLGDRVHLVGVVDDPSPYVDAASIVCHISYQDELPHAVLEAMARGKAIIASPVGGIPEVLRDGAEGLYAEGGPDGIAERVTALLSDAELRARLGERARERIREGHTWDRVITPVLSRYGLPTRKKIHLSFDVEEDYHAAEGSYRGVTEALPRLLDLLRSHRIPASFFITADVARRFPQLVSRIVADGHEIGSHGVSHKAQSFAGRPASVQRQMLEASRAVLDAAGWSPIGFRAPNFRVDDETLSALRQVALEVDSSVVPGRRVRSTRAAPRLDFRGAPLETYRPSVGRIGGVGRSSVLEVPVAANPAAPGSPLGLGYLNVAGPDETIRLVSAYPGEDVVFLAHPWEAIDYPRAPGLPPWMSTGCRSDLSYMDSFLKTARDAHTFVRFAELVRNPLESSERWWSPGPWGRASPPPRVFLVTHVYEPVIGGVTTYVKGLVGALRSRGMRVIVLAYPAPFARLEAAWSRFPLRKLFHATFVGACVARLALARLRGGPIVVHSHGASFALVVSVVAKGLGCPSVHTFHSPVLYRSLTIQLLAPRCDAILHVSAETMALYEETNGLRHDRVAIAPGGVDTARIPFEMPPTEKLAARTSYGLPESGFLALLVGRAVPEKGSDLAVEAFAKLVREVPDATLAIAGPFAPGSTGASYRASLESRAAAAGISDRVRILGAVSAQTIEDLVSAADCVVVPSRWEEPAPLVVAEACARGTPVVASRVGGLPSRVQDGATGLLFAADRPDELAERLLLLARDPALRNRLGREARAWAEVYADTSRLAQFHERIYAGLLTQLR